MKPYITLVISTVLLALFAAFPILNTPCLEHGREKYPLLLVNLSPSIPIGIYHLQPISNLKKNMLVVFPIPEHAVSKHRPHLPQGRLLIKPAAALAGEMFCVAESDCVLVPEGHFFPFSDYSENSFDGRYFGSVSIDKVIGVALPLVVFR